MRGLLVIALVVGCDSRATASDPSDRAEPKSREYETCNQSKQCQDELRCFDQVCRRAARSTVGDYYAAAGALARSRGDLEGAIAAFVQALAHYDAAKLSLPPEIDCEYGAALAAARTKKEHAELGARVLHRCVLAVPAGSKLRDRALGDLATLAEAGLDPVLLGANKIADLYLTKAPQRPATDRLSVAVTPTPQPTAKSYPLIPEKIAEPELRGALVACWEAYHAASKRDALTVAIGVKSSFIASDYDDEPGTFVVKLEPPGAGLAGPEAQAEACARRALEPAIKSLKLNDAFATRLAIVIK
jgi:hypothetical protein